MATMIRDGHVGGYVAGGDPGTWCPRLWTFLVRSLGVRSVLDLGCGEGHSTRFFHELGCAALGVDGCPQAVAAGVLPRAVVCHDLCAGPFSAGDRFDLVWSCEFLEHVDEAYLPHVLATLATAERYIAITHAFPGQRGHNHVNCRRSEYWIALVERLGFRCDLRLTRKARRATFADYHRVNHFGRSGLVFVRTAPRDAAATAWGALTVDDWKWLGRNPPWRARRLAFLLSLDTRVAKLRKTLSPADRARRRAERARRSATPPQSSR
jgi:SAM-dependent methyltransferase